MDEERRALRISIFGSLFFGALGVGFGVFAGSDAILLDGFFSLVNLVVGAVTLHVAGLVVRPVDERFQFGYANFEPLMNVVKALILLLVCGLALASAITSVVSGGRSLEMGWGLLYAVIASTGAFVVAGVQKNAAARTDSPLVAVEVNGWKIDGLMSLGVAVAFGLSFAIQGTRYSFVLPYVDPGLVIVLVLIALAMPLRSLKENLGELLLAAPPEIVQTAVRERVLAVADTLPIERVVIRMQKVGRQRAALVYLLVAPGTALEGIEELDRVRERITEELAGLESTWVADVLFVADEKWIA